MTDEIELKLTVDQPFADFLAQEISNFPVLSQKTVFLANCYYDTKEGYFARRKMGLRVRQQEGAFTLTLKTDGKVTGGLHIRPEYNAQLPSAEPDLTALARFEEVNIAPALELQPVFSTDFQRQMWIIECGNGAEIEIALDQGEINAGDKKEPICEVEFELKQGNIDDLLTFVSGLTLTDGVRLSALSKAKRGYRLAASDSRQVTDWLTKWRELIDLQSKQTDKSAVEKTREILTALFHHEQQLIEETVVLGADFFAQDFLRTVERVGAFFNLYHHYLENGKLLESAVGFQQEIRNLAPDDSFLSALIESNHYLFEQVRDIIRLHSESKDNLLAMRKLTALLHQGQYVKRMINLIKLTVD